jgi:hydroxyacylglutathione hydrolase
LIFEANGPQVFTMEDDFTYVIRKALRGHDLAPAEAAALAGLREGEVMGLLRGKFSEQAARAIAPVLGLSEEALATLPAYEAKTALPASIRQLDMPFGGDGQVNAWLIRESGTAVLFDAGPSAGALEQVLDPLHAGDLDGVFLTHIHPDHTGGADKLRARGYPVHFPSAFRPGETIRCGALTLHTIDLAGHCDGALGYLIDGLTVPVCVVGDALFAGSIGGCPDSQTYLLALANLREHVFTLPDETILLPGHGPATTIGDERKRNPFLG